MGELDSVAMMMAGSRFLAGTRSSQDLVQYLPTYLGR